MAVTVRQLEKITRERGRSPFVDTYWEVEGTTDEAEAEAALIAQTPARYANLFRQKTVVSNLVGQSWDAQVKYTGNPTPEVGSVRLIVGGAAGRETVTQAVKIYDSARLGGGKPPDQSGVIGIDSDGVANGVEQPVPGGLVTIETFFATDAVDLRTIRKIKMLYGRVNSDRVFGVYPPHELRFMQLHYDSGKIALGEDQDLQRLAFEFEWQPGAPLDSNIVGANGVTVGDLPAIAARGWDYIDIRYQKATFEEKDEEGNVTKKTLGSSPPHIDAKQPHTAAVYAMQSHKEFKFRDLKIGT